MKTKMDEAEGFVAVITSEFIKLKEKKMNECKMAVEANIPMYAIVKSGTKWAEFECLPWRRIFFFLDHLEIPDILIKVKKDLDHYRIIQEFGKR